MMEETKHVMGYISEILAVIVGVLIVAVMVTVAVVYFVNLTPEKRAHIINEVLFSLAIEAERLYGEKTGQVKKKQVIAWFYERYKWLALLLKKEELEIWIDEVVDDMNDWLKSNPIGAANII
jgi:hypothetical protein